MVQLDTGLAVARLADVPAAAREVEELGFSGLWTAETSHDPYLPVALAAEHTSRIDLGTSIAVAFPRSPMVHAMTAWDLAQQSEGRFILGLGTQVRGHNKRRFGVNWQKPGPQLREMIEMIRAAWDCFQNGTVPSFKGEYYEFTLMSPFFNPGPIQYPEIPIYIAGVNPYICRLAGEMCDGFHVHPLHSVEYVENFVRPWIAEGAAKAGRDPSSVQLASTCFTIVGDTEEEMDAMRQMVRSQISFYASTPAYKPVLAAHGWEDVAPHLTTKSRAGDWAGMADLITDEMLDVFTVTGTWSDIAGKMKARYEGVLDRIGFYVPFNPGRDTDRWKSLVASFRE